MPKLKLERVTGVVALCYLVLIPVAAYSAWRRLEEMDNDLTKVWEHVGMDTPEPQKKTRRIGVFDTND